MFYRNKIESNLITKSTFLLHVNLVLFFVLAYAFNNAYSQQDVWLQSYAAPNSGCGLTSNEAVNVQIYNNSGTSMGFNSIKASYSIDGGPQVDQLIGTTLIAFATVNFTFSVNANLSACGPHTIKVWVFRPGDPNQLNDTLTWAVNNDCIIVPGAISPNPIVCASLNSGALNLVGSSNGTITHWEMSNDGGTIWSNIANTTSTFNYTNIPQTRQYRVFIEGGACPDVYSAIATLTAIPQPVPGVIDGTDSLCILSASGSVYLTGTSNSVLNWESSLDNGTTWTTIPNTTYTNNFTNLTGTTLFRALIDGSICPNIYSGTAEIYIDFVSGPGVVSGSDSLCITNGNGTLNLSGPVGSTLYWQSSINNGLTWINIANTTSTLNYTGLTQPTLYRAFTQGAYCPSVFSDTAEIYIQPIPISPNLLGGDSLCITNANGSLSLPSPPNTILDWQTSIDNGATWVPIGNTATTESYTGLTQTTLYRVSLDGAFCANYYSNPSTIFVQPETLPGNITGPDTLCISSSNGTLTLNGTIGSTDFWEYSEDNGLSWILIPNTTYTESFTSLDTTTWFRAFSNGGFCPSFYSDTAIVFIEDSIVGGAIIGDGPFCVSATGILNLTNSSGTIGQWESSTDNGTTWNVIANTTTSESFTGLTSDYLYRVFIQGIYCAGGYSNQANISIDALSDAGANFSDTTICAGDDITFVLTGYIGDSIRWENSLNGVLWSTNLNATADSNAIIDAQTAEYQMVIVSNGVCPPDTTSIWLLNINPLPPVTVSADTTIYLGDSISLVGTGGATGLWTPNSNIIDNTIPNPIVFPTSTIYYTYNVIDLKGCMNSDSIRVIVNPALKIDIKNVVTLNGDGYNDTWIIQGIENFPNTSVKLFNIYGKEIYSNGDYANEWNGTYEGRTLPNGTYYYVVQLSDVENQIKGSLTLLGNE